MGFEFFHFSTRFVFVFKGVCFSIGFVYFYIKCVFYKRVCFLPKTVKTVVVFLRGFVSSFARAFFSKAVVFFFSRRG